MNVSKIKMEENLLREKLEMYQFLERRGRALHIFFDYLTNSFFNDLFHQGGG